MTCHLKPILILCAFVITVNGIGEDVGATVLLGKVTRPLRSVDPSQTEYQGLIEVTEEGRRALSHFVEHPVGFYIGMMDHQA